ncbi:MAG TPA: cytochrome c oxidase assembly factor Coa1 family protein [Rhodanobacteraceae bacterium]|jgi:hypothetical protein|nr:cytochrome c oxidase assembly factor Coa1 family protein [Rhodanobacteraceae bacterium]
MPSDTTLPRRNWWSRNWKWCVPVLCVIVAGAFVAAGVAFLGFIFGMMRSSTPYQEAMQRTRASPAVIAALGAPIESGWLFSGRIETSNDSGSADIEIPVHGPKGDARVHVRAEKIDGTWHYTIMRVRIDATQQRIDLLRPAEKVHHDNVNMFQARTRINRATYAYTPATTSSSITPSPP